METNKTISDFGKVPVIGKSKPAESMKEIQDELMRDSVVPPMGGNNTDMNQTFITLKPEQPMIQIKLHSQTTVNILTSKELTGTNGKTRFNTGLDWFDSKMTKVHYAVKEDDPFADQLYLDVEKGIAALTAHYSQQTGYLQQHVHSVLSQHDMLVNFSIDSYSALYNVPKFNLNISIKMLYLLKELDKHIYWIFLCEKYGCLSRDDAKTRSNDARRRFRNVLKLCQYWEATGITRKDIAFHTQRAALAAEKNKNINVTAEVLLMKERATLAPYSAAHYMNKISDQETLTGLLETVNRMIGMQKPASDSIENPEQTATNQQ